MRPIRHILVATDFGPASQRAIAAASDMAVALQAKVTVAHVLETAGALPPLANVRAAALRSLESIAAASFRARNVECATVLRPGERWREIVGIAEQVQADLVMVGSHGRRGLAHALLGSVAEKVVRRSRVPVLTVHGFWFEDRVHAGQELGKELAVLRSLKPAVIAISRGGIVVGAEAAKALGVSLDVLLTRPLYHDGTVFGALCEDGTFRLDPEATGLAKLPEEREKIMATELASLKNEALDLRGGAPWFADLSQRTVILVGDALTDSWAAAAAASVVKEAGAARILVAAPVVTDNALAALERELDGLVVLHSIPAGFEPSGAYRDCREPSPRSLASTFHGESTTAA